MTPAQTTQFNLYGCVARSLLALAADCGLSVSRDQFCQRFHSLFYDPMRQFGGILISDISEVIRAWRLGRHFLAFRRYAEIIDQAAAGRKVLVLSEINLNPGATDVIRHCSFLTGINAAGFSLLTPDQSGADIPLTLSAADWEAKLCIGLVII